jgi:hypothetical protein
VSSWRNSRSRGFVIAGDALLDSTVPLWDAVPASTRNNHQRANVRKHPNSSLRRLFLQCAGLPSSQLSCSLFQHRAYEQGTRASARLNQTQDDLHALRCGRDDALRDLNASKDQIRVCVAELDKWTSEARHLSCIFLGLRVPSFCAYACTHGRRIER